jgi:hypothetical protein
VVLAARGARDLDSGEEPVTDERLREELRRRGRKIHVRALATAAALTFLLWWLPR